MTGCKVGKVTPRYTLLYIACPGADPCPARLAELVPKKFQTDYLTIAVEANTPSHEQILYIHKSRVTKAKAKT